MNSPLYDEFKNYNNKILNKELEYACNRGDLEIVKYLLTSPELEENAYIHCNEDSPLVEACMYGHLEIIKYLLTSPELKEHADLHVAQDFPFITSCRRNITEVIEYFIFELNIEKSVHIKEFLKDFWNGQKIENMFELRELNKKLNQDLSSNQKIVRKPKV